MKILHAILSGGFYGSERYCIDLAIAQALTGHDVIVLVTGGDTACAQQFRQLIAEASSGSAPEGTVRLVEIPPSVPAWLQRPVAAAMLMRIRPDIVHTHLNPAARRIGRTAQRLGIPHVLTLHLDYDPREHAAIDGLVALSAKQREQIPKNFAGEVAIIWNWLPSRVQAALVRVEPADVARLRHGWQADEATVVFGSVGRLMPEKGMDTLIRAFKLAFPVDRESVRLIIVGEGDDRTALEQLAAEEPRIVFAGSQSEIAPFYPAFDVFVNAARFEPFSLAIIEAMAAGCRLICTSIHGTVEFVTDRRVLWTEPDRHGSLALQLAAAMARKRERFAYDMSPFRLSRAVAEIDAFYGRVIAGSKR
jgi:glycosyltransferase involved in cell wall biosynthesis